MTEKQKKWSQIEKIMYIKSVAFKGWFKCDTFSYILRLEIFSIFLPMNLYHGSNAVIFAGELSVNETLDRLKIKRLFNQYVFKNETVLKQLIFVRAKFVE